MENKRYGMVIQVRAYSGTNRWIGPEYEAIITFDAAGLADIGQYIGPAAVIMAQSAARELLAQEADADAANDADDE